MPGRFENLPGSMDRTIPSTAESTHIHMKTFRLIRNLLPAAILAVCILPRTLSAAPATDAQIPYDPRADPRAVVTVGSARFTILTPQLIRMEWASDRKFEDHASLVFLNRRLGVPEFTRETGPDGSTVIRTSALTLDYAPNRSDGKFTPENLSISFNFGEKKVVWKPGIPDTGNLLGTARTLDFVRGSVPLEPGLVSRDGWTVVDDSTRALFDSDDFSFARGEDSQWPWVILRPGGARP